MLSPKVEPATRKKGSDNKIIVNSKVIKAISTGNLAANIRPSPEQTCGYLLQPGKATKPQ